MDVPRLRPGGGSTPAVREAPTPPPASTSAAEKVLKLYETNLTPDPGAWEQLKGKASNFWEKHQEGLTYAGIALAIVGAAVVLGAGLWFVSKPMVWSTLQASILVAMPGAALAVCF